MNDLGAGTAMRKFFTISATIGILSLSFPLFAQGATKSIAQTPMTLVTSLASFDQSVGMVVRGKMIYVIGTGTGVANTDGFVQALDSMGTVQWSLPLDNGSNVIATAATFDASGNIWVVGSAQTPSASPIASPTPSLSPTPTLSPSVSPSPTPSSTPTVLNPDGVKVDAAVPMRGDLTSLALWKISPSGVLLASYAREISSPFLIRNVIFANNAISMVGIIPTPAGHAGLFIQSDLNGTFGKPILVGKSDTELNALSKRSDGSLLLLGSSSETIAKQTNRGVKDGIVVTVTQAGKISSVVRSFNTASTRSWQSSTNSLFFGGDALATGKKEAVVTKFSSTLVPAWTMRFVSSSPALTADSSTSHFLLITSAVAIAGIKGWKPSKESALVVGLDSKGALNGAYGALTVSVPIAIGYSRDLGLVLLGLGPTGVSIFHALPR